MGKWTRDLEHKLDLVLKLGLEVFLADGLLPAVELLHVAIHVLTDHANIRGEDADVNTQIFSQLIIKLHLAKDDGNLVVRVGSTGSFDKTVFGLLDLWGGGRSVGKRGRGANG